MKLASLKNGRDGILVVVNRDLTRCQIVPGIAATLQSALDRWAAVAPQLQKIYDDLNTGQGMGGDHFDVAHCAAPLPRAYQIADGSAYLNHVDLVRRARGAEMPPEFLYDPLMYQAVSDIILGPCDPIVVADAAYGIDFEGEIAVITDDVPMGVAPAAALGVVRLVMLMNDISLRQLIPAELAKGFGFFQSKPPSAFSPVAVTPDELGDAWRDGKLHGALSVMLNGQTIGRPDAGADMQFDFGTLIAHAAKTRPLGAGAIIGSGTVSNRDRAAGVSCLAEIRMIEKIEQGQSVTPFMAFGDVVRLDMHDSRGRSIFGAIEQRVVRA